MINGLINKIQFVSDPMLDRCHQLVSKYKFANSQLKYFQNSIQNGVNDRGDIMYTYTVDGEIMGFVKGKITNPPDDALGLPLQELGAEIEWLYVGVQHRNGVGQRLFDTFENHVKKYKVKSLFVYSAETNQAISFYKKNKLTLRGPDCLMGRMIEYNKKRNFILSQIDRLCKRVI